MLVRTGVFESDSLTPQWGFGGRKGHGSVWEESTRDEESLAVYSLLTLPSTLSVRVSFKWPLSRSRNERKRSGAKRGEIQPGPGSTWASDTPDKGLLSCPSSGCKLIAWLLNTREAHAGKAQANYSMGPELRGPVSRGILGLQGCSWEALICHQACC